jgi:hypothetical protein
VVVGWYNHHITELRKLGAMNSFGALDFEGDSLECARREHLRGAEVPLLGEKRERPAPVRMMIQAQHSPMVHCTECNLLHRMAARPSR